MGLERVSEGSSCAGCRLGSGFETLQTRHGSRRTSSSSLGWTVCNNLSEPSPYCFCELRICSNWLLIFISVACLLLNAVQESHVQWARLPEGVTIVFSPLRGLVLQLQTASKGEQKRK